LTETQEQKQQLANNNSMIVENGIIIPHKHRIYSVTEGIRSKKTAFIYEKSFNRFLNFIKIHDEQVLLDFSPKVIKQMIVDYVLYLRDGKRLSRVSIKVDLAAILRFFQNNNDDFNLTIKNFRLHLPSDDLIKDEDRPYTTEEIAQALRDCDLRSKVVILLLCSTGMRRGALHTLQIGHLTEVHCQMMKLYKVQVYAGTKAKYYTFCTPECYQAIQDYLDYRKRCGEDPLKDKSPLIREQFNVDDNIRIQYPRFMTEKAIEYLLRCNLNRSGVRKVGEVHMSHGFRKFFMTQCERSGMKSINVKMLLGHDIGVSGHYYRPQESDILEDFVTHSVDALTISDEHRLKTKVQELEGQQAQEIAQLNAQLQSNNEELAKARQYQDSSKLSIQELEARVKATEDKWEKSFLALEYARKSTIVSREREKKELEEMSPRYRKFYLEWQKASDYGKKESLVDYYTRNRKKYFT
jgi:integrase